MRDSKGTFHAKMDKMKERNSMEIKEAEYIKKRWQENRVNVLMTRTKLICVVIHLEPDMLECKVKGTLGSIATNRTRGGGIPAELFQILKMMLLKCCTQYASKFGKLNSGHRTGKTLFIPTPKKGNAKECSNYCLIALISHASTVMLKIFHARLQLHIWTENFQIYKMNLEKAKEPEIKLQTSTGS